MYFTYSAVERVSSAISLGLHRLERVFELLSEVPRLRARRLELLVKLADLRHVRRYELCLVVLQRLCSSPNHSQKPQIFDFR